MEPEMYVNCRNKNCVKCCVDLISVILIATITFVIGLLYGALTGLAGFLGIGAITVLIVLLLIMLITRIIMLKCKEVKRC